MRYSGQIFLLPPTPIYHYLGQKFIVQHVHGHLLRFSVFDWVSHPFYFSKLMFIIHICQFYLFILISFTSLIFCPSNKSHLFSSFPSPTFLVDFFLSVYNLFFLGCSVSSLLSCYILYLIQFFLFFIIIFFRNNKQVTTQILVK